MIYANILHFYEWLFVYFCIFMNDFYAKPHTFMNDIIVSSHLTAPPVKIALATGLVLGDFPPSITCPFFVYCPAESPITLLAFCLFIISNTFEFSSLHRLYPIARRASYRRSRPITSWRYRAIRSLPVTPAYPELPFPPSVLLSQFTSREFPRFFVCPLSRISFDSPLPITYNL